MTHKKKIIPFDFAALKASQAERLEKASRLVPVEDWQGKEIRLYPVGASVFSQAFQAGNINGKLDLAEAGYILIAHSARGFFPSIEEGIALLRLEKVSVIMQLAPIVLEISGLKGGFSGLNPSSQK